MNNVKSKKSYIIIILCIFIIFLIFCNNEEKKLLIYNAPDNAYFYRKMKINPAMKIKLIEQISDTIRRHLFEYYVVEYNKDNKIEKIQHIRGQKLSKDDAFEDNYGIFIKYAQEADTFIYLDNNGVLDSTKVFIMIKDKKGNYISKRVNNKDIIYYEYNKLNQCVKKRIVNKDEEITEDKVCIYKYQYDSLGNVIREEYFNINNQAITNESQMLKKEYLYNGDYLMQITIYSEKGGAYKVVSEYNEDKRLIKSISFINDTFEYNVVYEYDKYGNMIELRYENENNELIDPHNDGAIMRIIYKDNGEVKGVEDYSKEEGVIRSIEKL